MRITDIHKMIVGYNRKTQHRGGILVPITNYGSYGYNDYRYGTYYVVDDIKNFVKTFKRDFEYELENECITYYLFFPFREDCSIKVLQNFIDKTLIDELLMNVMCEFETGLHCNVENSEIFEPTLDKQLVKAIEDIHYNF